MASNVLTLVIDVRWWVIPYLNTIALFCGLTGYEPDMQKITRFIARHGIRVRKS